MKKKLEAANRKLFENPGKKIKEHAILIFWIEVLASIILAFAFGIRRYYSYWDGAYYTTFRAGYFFGILIGGPVYAYASQLALVGFGELIEKTAGQTGRGEPAAEAPAEPAAPAPAAAKEETVPEKETAPAAEAGPAAEQEPKPTNQNV